MRFSAALLNRSKVEIGELTKRYANFPEAYLKKCVEEVEWSTPRGLPQYLPKRIVHRKRHFETDRPWTSQFQRTNDPNVKHEKVFIEPVLEWSFFRGDMVEIIKGPDKGKQGTVIQVIQERNWVIVEGLNAELKCLGKTKAFPGTVVKIEKPLLINHEVILVDPSDLQGTPVEWRFTEEGDKVRVSTRTGRIIPIPIQAEQTHDYKAKNLYKENVEKDTPDSELTKITFVPKLTTFAMDIMNSLGIKEDRVPVKTYWY